MAPTTADPYVEHSLRTSMYFPSTRLFVAGNPKAAGTTLRWWLLEAHGVDVASRTANSWWGESAPYQTVWDARINLDYAWPDLSERHRHEALTAPDVLTVHPVRHPLTRLFSAWSGKYLVGEPYYQERLPDGFPTIPAAVDDEGQVAELFEQFADALREAVSQHGFPALDVHFWPQSRLLAQADGTELVVRQEAIGQGFAAITKHLADQDLTVGSPPHINETVVPYRAELISERAKETAMILYGDDFDRWQYSSQLPPSSSRQVDIDWLNDVRGRNRRYGVLHRELNRLDAESSRVRTDDSGLTARERELLESTSWKVTAPLRWVSQNLKH